MADLLDLQTRFDRGMRREEPRGQMVKGSVWDLVDYVPNLDDAPLAERGGTSYASPDLSTITAGASRVVAGKHAPFSGGNQLVVLDEDTKLYKVDDASTATDKGAANAPLQNPVFHSNTLIVPSSDGTETVKKYDGSAAPSALGGSPPAGKYAEVSKDRTVLANTAAQPTRVYFSGAADPTSWNTTSGYLSVQSPVTGLAALPNTLMVFMQTTTARVTGSTPPPGTDMTIADPIFNVGCSDARSIATYGPYAVFANPLGIFRTNGSLIPEDLTAAVGLKRYWRELLASYTSSWTLGAGILDQFYVISVMDGATFKDCLWIHLADLWAFRTTNMKFVALAQSRLVGEELYAFSRATPRVLKLSTCLTPSATYKNDADGAAVAGIVETPYYTAMKGRLTWRYATVSHDLREAASDNPSITVSYARNPEDGYTALSQTLAETSNLTDPERLYLNFPASGLALKLTRANASASSRIYALRAHAHSREASRRAA